MSSAGSSSKRAKIDISSEIKPNVNLSQLNVDNITKIWVSYQEPIFQDIESCYSQQFHDSFTLLQHRLHAAQIPRSSSLASRRATLSVKTLPKPNAIKKLGIHLGELSRHSEVPSSVKDGLRYYEACCVNLACFSQNSGNAQACITEMAGDQKPTEYFEGLVAASERFLKNTTSSNQPVESQLPTYLAAAPATIPTSTTTTKPASSSSASLPEPAAASSSGQHDTFSDEYLQAKVSNYIVKEEDLKRAVPWDQLYNCDARLKKRLVDEYDANEYLTDDWCTPPGILLHGVTGTGKTTIVRSFAAHKGLTLFEVDASIHGSLRGQTEKLIKYIFEAVTVEAAKRQCILFFDEVDGVLGKEGRNARLESVTKQVWGNMMSAKVRCFVFGATNKPWNINMADWGRRFRLKVHVKIPPPNAREQAIKHALSRYPNTVNADELAQLAAATTGFSTDDVTISVQSVGRMLHLGWIRAGGTAGGTERRQITAEMIIDGIAAESMSRTFVPEDEERHQEWDDQFNR